MQQGIRVLQQKLAAVIQELSGAAAGNAAPNLASETTAFDTYSSLKTPDPHHQQQQQNQSQPGAAGPGYGTPYGGGGSSVWGGGAAAGGATPYGATPYGQSGNPW